MRAHTYLNVKRAAFLSVSALALSIASVTPAAAEEEFELLEVTVSDLQEAYEDGTYTAEQVTESYLERIERYEDHYNAFTFLNDQAIEDAKASDERIQNGEAGTLEGIPVVIKEAVDVEGFQSTFGWEGFGPDSSISIVPELDAPIVQDLRAEGAIIVGKTNIPAFSTSGTRADTSWAGDTYNAVDRALAPGGSSSGTATAISGNFAVLGVAEETGGSIQNPAAAQSLVSVKPSFGLVPNTGTTPLAANTRDVLGPHSRSVEDAAIMLDVTAGYTVQDPKTIAAIGNIPANGYADSLSEDSLEGKRIGLYGEGWRDEELSEETEELYERSIEELEALGAEVVEDPFAGSEFIDVMEQYGNIGYEALVSDFQAYLDRLNPSGDLPSIAELFEQAEEVPWAEGGPLAHFGNRGVDFEEDLQNPYDIPKQVEFTKARTAYLHIVDQVIEDHDLDGFVYPQMSEEIPNLHGGDHSATTVLEINMSGLPLVTVPAGNYESGSPFSLAFFGEMWSEQDLLAMAYSYEQDTNYREAPVLEQPEQDESVIRNIQPTEDQTLQAGESVRVSFEGESGLEASFAIRIPLFTRAAAPTEIMMREVEDGYYEGYWTATNNLQVEGAEIEIKAIDQEGQEFREVAEGRLSIEQ